MKIAIIGTGIAGMGCGHFLHNKHDLTFYEQNDYVGGHTNTVCAEEDGKQIPIDTGFMVFNNITYPNLVRLFDELEVESQPTDMSFSVQHVPSKLEYCGTGLNGLFAQRKNIFNIKHIRMLLQIDRFNKESIKILDDPKYDAYSLLDYVKEQKYGSDFLYKYISPMSSALWSTPTDITLKFPVKALVRFFKNHGFLGLNTQFQWYTVKNGSWQYRDKLIRPFKDKIQTSNGATRVSRENGQVRVWSKDGSSELYDKVIMACHADQALRLIDNPTIEEKRLLSKFNYQENIALLHTDSSIMPQKKSVWSSWNYRIGADGKPGIIYYMNQLQKVSDKENYFVSINDPGTVNPSKIIKKIVYEHPIFTTEGVKAQSRLHELNYNTAIHFCGSYFKYGFHEDAFTSALELCRIITGEKIWGESAPVINPTGETTSLVH